MSTDFAKGRGAATLGVLGLILAGLALASGCRERTNFCGESDCSRLPGGAAGQSYSDMAGDATGASGGYTGSDASEASGGDAGSESMAGAAGVAECSRDRDCDDARACNGSEVCDAGHCRTIPAECAPPTRCVEQPSGFSCEFERAPNWLVYYADEITKGTLLLAQPLEYLDEVPGLEVARGTDLEGLPIGIPWSNAWSPNGRYLALQTGTGLLFLQLRLLLAEFGAGLPEPARLAKDIPQRTDLLVEDWSVDSRRLLVLNLSNQYEAYVMDVQANRTSLLFADGGGADFLHFCADSRLVTRQYPDGIHLLNVETGSNSAAALPGASGVELSLDRRWLYFENAEGFWVTACAESGKPQRLAARREEIEENWPEWSADGQLLALQLDEADVTIFDVDTGFKRVATFPGESYRWHWGPQAHRLAGTRSDATDGAALFLVDLSKKAPGPQRLSTATGAVSDVTWVNDELLAYGAQAADGTYEAHLVRAVAPFDDRIVTSFAPDVVFHSLQYEPLGRYLFFVQQEGELEQVYALSLLSSSAKPQAILDAPSPADLTLPAFTPDGTGLVVQYRAPDPEKVGSLWWVAFDEHGVRKPRAIYSGHNTAFATLRPRP